MKVKNSIVLDFFGMIIALCFINPMITVTNQMVVLSVVAIWFFLATYYDNKRIIYAIKRKSIFWVIFYVVVICVNAFLERSILNKQNILLIFIIIFSQYYLSLSNIERIKRIVYISSLYFGMIVCISIVKLTANPNLARLLASGQNSIVKQYGSIFTATYHVVYSIALITGALVGISLYTKQIWIWIVIGVNILFLIKAQYAIALLLAILSFFLILLYVTNGKGLEKYIKLFVVICLLFLVVLNINNIFEIVINELPQGRLQERLIEVQNILLRKNLLQYADSTNRFNFSSLQLILF